MNENPVAQVVILGVLALVVGFLLMTRVFGSEEAAPETTSATAPATAPSATAASEAEAAAASAQTQDAAPAPTNPATGASAGAAGEFAPGPGLPEAVVDAHEAGDTVALLITRKTAPEDQRMRGIVDGLRGRDDVSVFTTVAKHVARYSRVTRGVDLDRVPALIVIRPPSASSGNLPEATVAYAYRGFDSVEQAVRDAGYKGPENLPYHPR